MACAEIHDGALRGRDRSRFRGDSRDRGQGVHLQPLLRLSRSRRRRPGRRPGGIPSTPGGPRRSRALEAVLMPLRPELGFVPYSGPSRTRPLGTRAASVPQLPQQPHRRGCPRGASSSGWSSLPASTMIPGCPRQLLLGDHLRWLRGAQLPGLRPAPGQVGEIEVFSLSKGFNMTGWRCAAVLGNAVQAHRLSNFLSPPHPGRSACSWRHVIRRHRNRVLAGKRASVIAVEVQGPTSACSRRSGDPRAADVRRWAL